MFVFLSRVTFTMTWNKSCVLTNKDQNELLRTRPMICIIDNTNGCPCSQEHKPKFMVTRTQTKVHVHKNMGKKLSLRELNYKDSENIFCCNLFRS